MPEKNKRIAFLIPYFGKFNNYFPLWLKSCDYNSDIVDFFIFSDINYDDYIPDNVKFIKISWNKLHSLIQSFYDFDINLGTPYALCDFKCAYGEIFQDYIKNYSHWAYGDIDLIWGNWKELLPDNWFNYDKLGNYGHLTILKNNPEMNKLYRYKDAYKIAFCDKRNLFFDEIGFNLIANKLNKKTHSLKIANCHPRIRKITCITPPLENKESSGLFKWENGILENLYVNRNGLQKEKVMYIHFLKRNMTVNSLNSEGECLIIHDVHIDKYKNLGEQQLKEFIITYSGDKFYKEYWKKYLSIKQIINTLKAHIFPILPKMKEIENLILNN